MKRKYYISHARPVISRDHSVLLFMNLSLIQIVDVDEKNQFITLSGWVNQEWSDPSFIWDPKQYGNVTELYIPSRDIWTPDLVLYNNSFWIY
ncbi:unnamed protein product [Protopolystoma xenopodis]|uniref:Neurotransmitter-gated ion-channel ligand-binding domain-containing protein n=1 Tax=Protopolystoma xenopodis TaxID=117903 RepID=A0A448WKE5_9PLAT|nr:unnamed protein product [Protopolystoma xenopodis]